jgi:hypothetical protein
VGVQEREKKGRRERRWGRKIKETGKVRPPVQPVIIGTQVL